MSVNRGFVEYMDSVIVSDLLYFVYNKLKTTQVKNIVTTCHNFYTDNNFVFGEKNNIAPIDERTTSA